MTDRGKTPYKDGRWPGLAARILDRDGYMCKVQGPHCRIKATQCDHIIPWRDGGSWFDEFNLRASCDWCNTWRAQRQKSRDGWKRSTTRVVLVVGPIAAGKSSYVREHAGSHDLVIDYDAISKAIGPELPRGHGGERHEMVRKLRNKMLTDTRRGDVAARVVWIVSCNPLAERYYPHHEVVVVNPGIDEVLRRCATERPAALWPLVREWYAKRATVGASSSAWDW